MQRNAYFEQFELNAGTRPEAVAIEAPEGCLTYGALNRQANRIAHALTGRGLGPGGRGFVGLYLEPGIAYVAGLFGTGKAGGVFLPLDPSLPDRRLGFQLDRAGVRLIVTDAAHAEALAGRLARIAPDSRIAVVVADRLPPGLPEHDPGIGCGPTDGCYVMFTSGSTGTPKAILGQQKGLSHFLRWEIAEFGLSDSVRSSWLAPTTFDVSLRDILVPLMAGGTLCVPAAETRLTPHRLADWIAASRLTLVHCVPTLLRLLTRELEARGSGKPPADPPFPDLAHLLVAGEPLFGADVAAWRAVAGERTELVNLYGPSETTLAKVFHRVGALPNDLRRVLPIGHPLPNTAVLILKNGRLCAPEEIGEIYIRTPYRSLGYLNDPELTAASFVQNPLSPDTPDIVYRTGDLGRLIEGRRIECLGRLDGQVKVNGIRIELGEIEAAMRELDGIGEVVVTAQPAADNRQTLVCYYTRRDGADAALPVADLKAGLAELLPAAMHPHLFVPLAEMPRTISGKVNRKALPRPEALFYERYPYVAAATEAEERLCRIWGELFGLSRIGVTNTFMEFGGDSLKAIRALSRIYQEFAIDVGLKDFFENQTIRALARVIERSRAAAVAAIPRTPAADHYPASPAQSRLWTLDRMGIAPTAYNLAEAYVLDGPVDAAALQRAFETLIERHESLRTTFAEVDGQPRQVVHDHLDWRLERLDLCGAADPATAAEALAEGNRNHRFDLERGPLLRALLARLPDGPAAGGAEGDGAGANRAANRAEGAPRHLFLVNIHHIISDVWSLGVLVGELAACYRAFAAGAKTAPALAPLVLQYRDFAAWQTASLTGEAMLRHRAYWLEQLAGELPALDLPSEAVRPPVQTFNGTTHRVRLDPTLTAGLAELARGRGTSVFMLLTAVVKALLHRYTGQEDVIVGSPVLGRRHPDLEPQIGYYVNTLALRDRVAGSQPFAELLAGVARTVTAALDHQDYPFDALVKDLRLQRDMSRSPVFDVMVVVQTFEPFALRLEGLRAAPFGPENVWNFSRYDMVFHFMETPDGLTLDLNYNTDLYSAAQIARCGTHLTELIRTVLVAPETPVGRLALVGADEAVRLAVFAAGSVVPRETGDAATIPGRFAAVAARQPDAPALIGSGSVILSYRTYDEVSERLARRLVESHGLRREDRVGVIANRSIESMLAMMAIFKAGGVYVPIDADYPEARIRLMLERAACRLVLVDRPEDAARFTPEGLPVLAVSNGLGQIGLLPAAASARADDRLDPAAAPTANTLAYMIFTSGSTGVPKGVMVEHGGFVNMSLGQIEALGILPHDRVLQFASPSFDASLANIFMALFAGAAVVLPDRADIENVERLRALLVETETTVITLPPVYLRALGRAPLPPLQVLITAGEAAPAADLRHHAEAGNLHAFNAYGPTETSVCATMHRVGPADAGRPRIPIGRPLPNTAVYVLDAALQPVPIGVAGEIHIGGRGVARGYWRDAEQTEARFVADPFTPGGRLYRTGDLGRWLEDGSLDFLGRADDQVKVAGNRIELGEVDHALRTVPGIGGVHVTTVAQKDGGVALAGYYVPERRAELWPSVAEFYVYDDVAYTSMATDAPRNRQYSAAFAKVLPGRTVVDIGTGPFAILARLAVEAGAAKVYAIDLLEESCRKARETVAALGLADRITVIHGNAETVTLPEPADYCISEIVGAIGGAEGAARIINRARRLLKDPANMLPQRSLTRIAAVSLPEGSFDYGFSEIAAHYVERIFAETGRPFDLRLCVKHLPRTAIVSTDAPFEDLDYTREVPLEARHEIVLEVTRPAALTGFIAWLHLFVDAAHDVDILQSEGSWLPVYLPAFPEGEPAEAGDRIVATVTRTLCDNGLNPDFVIAGRLVRAGRPDRIFRYHSPHIAAGFGADPFYARLFADGAVRRIATLSAVEIRRHLARLLPSYAVPTYLVPLDALPVTASGKVDRAALPDPTTAAAGPAARRGPSGALEETVLAIWCRVLERDDIGVDDDFFARGGDSIRAIQIVSALHQAGLKAEIRDIFQNPTVARFALQVRPLRAVADQGPVTGAGPLTPIQRWFFATITADPHHFNQAVLLRARQPLDAAAAAQAVQAVWRHHDALRSRFVPAADGPQQIVADPDSAAGFALVHLETDAPGPLEAAAEQIHGSFRLAEGPLFTALLARAPGGDALLLVAHHLVVDAVSWRILVEDVITAYGQAAAGRAPELPCKTGSYRAHAEALQRLATGDAIAERIAWWRAIAPPPPLPHDRPAAGGGTMGDSGRVAATLPAAATAALLGPVHAAYATAPDDLLLAALGLAVRQVFGHDRVLVDLEWHGREPPLDDAGATDQAFPDVSRTVGWFTGFHPFLLETVSEEPGTLIKAVKEAVRRVPDRGRSYGLLTWLRDDWLRDGAGLRNDAGLPRLQAAIGFNDLGSFTTGATGGPFAVEWDAPGGAVSPRIPRIHDIDVLVMVVDGVLTLQIEYDKRVFEDGTAERLLAAGLDALRRLIDHCLGREKAEPTPSDFTYANLSLEQLADLLEAD